MLAISNFWQKYSNSASALAHCENLLSEFIKGDILVSAGDETQRRQQQPQNQQQEQQEQQEQQQQQETTTTAAKRTKPSQTIKSI